MADSRRNPKKKSGEKTGGSEYSKDRRISSKPDEEEIELIENPVFDNYVIETVPLDSEADSSKPEDDDSEVAEETDAEEEPKEQTPEEKKADEVIAELHDRNLRLQAEFNNFRKRQAREFSRLCSQGKRELVENLLDVLDNFERAMKHRNDKEHGLDEVAEGMYRTIAQFKEVMQKEGLEILEVKEKDAFAPEMHEAMYAEEVEGLKEDTVIEVLQNGYMLNNELLRPARVRVGKPPKAMNGGEDNQE